MFSDSVDIFLSECHRNFLEKKLGLKDLDLESEGGSAVEKIWGREDLVFLYFILIWFK